MPPDNPVVSGLDASAAAAVSPPQPAAPQPQQSAEQTPPATASATPASDPIHLSHVVEQAARENNIPPQILHAQAQHESGLRPQARSPKGAEGVMQIMPRTARQLGVNAENPEENIHGGAQYMKQLHDQFGSWDKALAAYNWGPHHVHEASVAHGEKWLDDAPPETKKYVSDIMAAKPFVGPIQPEKPAATPNGPTMGPAPHTLHERVDDFFHMPAAQYDKKYQADDDETSKKVEGVLQHLIPFYKDAEGLQKTIEGTKAGKQTGELIKDQLAHPENMVMGGVEGPEGEVAGALEGMAAKLEKSPQSGNLASIPGAITTKSAPKIGALENVPGDIKVKPAAVETAVEGPQWERTLTAKMGDVPAGKVGYKVDPSGKAQIYGAVVHPELRGQGLGTKLYKSLIEDARAGGATEITSDPTNTSPAANRVWQKLGEQGYPVEAITHPNGKAGYRVDLTLPKPPATPQEAVEAAGGTFKGMNSAGLVEIALPRSMTNRLNLQDRMKDFVTITMPKDEITPEAVKSAMDAKFKQFGGKPE